MEKQTDWPTGQVGSGVRSVTRNGVGASATVLAPDGGGVILVLDAYLCEAYTWGSLIWWDHGWRQPHHG